MYVYAYVCVCVCVCVCLGVFFLQNTAAQQLAQKAPSSANANKSSNNPWRITDSAVQALLQAMRCRAKEEAAAMQKLADRDRLGLKR